MMNVQILRWLLLATVCFWRVSSELCVPMVECSRDLNRIPRQTCRLIDNSFGVVCHNAANRIRKSWHNDEFPRFGRKPPPFSGRMKYQRQGFLVDVSLAKEAARKVANQAHNDRNMWTRQAKFSSNGNVMDTPNRRELQFLSGTSFGADSNNRTLYHLRILGVLSKIGSLKKIAYPKSRVRRSTDFSMLIPDCEPASTPACSEKAAEFWRNDIGQCNHLEDTRTGATLMPQVRMLPARYEDGVSEPLQTGNRGFPLPSTRTISAATIDTSTNTARLFTGLLLVFGQLVAHDLVLSATQLPANGNLSSCCQGLEFPQPPLDEDCWPIRVSARDPLYRHAGVRCLNQFRSRVAAFELSGCLAQPASPENQVTHYLDASIIYGSSSQQVHELRAGQGGKLKMDSNNMLTKERGRFLTGEGRSNVTPMLSFLHTLLAREHNRIAEELQRLRPEFSDLQLFMLARRIFVGEYQHIVYNEYLTIILGVDYMDKLGISVDLERPWMFDELEDPSITVEFSTAAFRFGHSMVMNDVVLRGQNAKTLQKMKLTDLFFGEDILNEPNMFEAFGRSLLWQSPGNVGSSFSPATVEQLFANSSENLGLDLVALNLNRGRDHGLPSYIQMRRACTGEKIGDRWSDLLKFFHRHDLLKLKRAYRSVHDIELYIGGILEKKKPGVFVPPIFQCIIGNQFHSLLYGDRFFYLHRNTSASFSERQIAELKKASFSRLLCDNMKLKQLPPNALWQQNKLNPIVSCKSKAIPKLDISVFVPSV